ncbi:MAG: pyrroloquinoline quinone precursor peptide PqqA [Gemmatimonadota bacterium]
MWRTHMKWEAPTFEALEMGFEVTMYVYIDK